MKGESGAMTGEGLIRFFRRAWEEFRRDRCFDKAGALAFGTVLSCVPVMILSLTFIAAYFEESEAREWVQTYLVNLLLPEDSPLMYIFTSPAPSDATAAVEAPADPREELRDLFNARIDDGIAQIKVSAMGTRLAVLFALLLIAVSLFRTIEVAFNAIWRVERGRPLMRKVTTAWTVMTLGPILVALAVFSGSLFNERLPIGWLAHVIFLWVLLTLLYKLVPHTFVPLRPAAIGAAVATFLVYLSKTAFGAYMVVFPTLPLIFGSIAMVAFFLLWVWLVWAGVLYGAEIVVCRQYGVDRKGKLDPGAAFRGYSEYQAVRVMLDVCREHLGREAKERPAPHPAPAVEALLAGGLLIRSDDDEAHLAPSRSPDRITVAEVLQAVASTSLQTPPDAGGESAEIIRRLFAELKCGKDEAAGAVTIASLLK